MFVEFVDSNTDNFKVVGNYVNNSTKIEIQHLVCGRVFNTRPADFKKRKSCVLCNSTKKWTTEQYIDSIKNLVGEEYSILGEYVNADTKIKTKHNTCGYVWEVSPDKFKNKGTRCPKCVKRFKKSTQDFNLEVFNLVREEYETLSDYLGAHKKVKFKHLSELCDNNIFEMSPTDFLRGRRCPKCADFYKSGMYHWKWNPDLSDKDRQKRDMYNGELKKWRTLVYKKDNYKCLVCKNTGGNLNAHHKNSWDKFPDERFSVTNGATLCEICHRTFHKVYGYGNNTEIQFVEFLSANKI